MIRMKINRTDYSDNTPILYNREIDEFAYAVLKDYKPQLLREPGKINFEHFLESYLGVTLMFKDIYNDDPEHPIFGMTVFRDGTVKIFNRKNNCVSNMLVRANTIIIDNFVMERGKEGLALFTGLHESGHFLIHPAVYSTFRAGQICCRRDNVESFGVGQAMRTSEQWREHQADYFAAALAMPNATFIPFVHNILREHEARRRCIVLGESEESDILARDILPECISEVYGVSKHAAFIKLKKTDFVSGTPQYQYEKVQYTY